MKIPFFNLHIALSCLLTLLFSILVTQEFQKHIESFRLWWYFPLILLYIYLQAELLHKQGHEEALIICINIFVFIMTATPFFLVYFLVVWPTQRYTFVPADSCRVVGRMAPVLQDSEQFSILYVDMVFQGKSMLGYSCMSSENEGNSIYFMPYDFYEKGDSYICDKPLDDFQLGEYDYCLKEYTFSEVKIPSWMCIPQTTTFEDMLALSSCNVAFYNDPDDAKRNAETRQSLLEATSFAMVIFQEFPNVNQSGIAAFIIFTYLPMLSTIMAIIALLVQKYIDFDMVKPYLIMLKWRSEYVKGRRNNLN